MKKLRHPTYFQGYRLSRNRLNMQLIKSHIRALSEKDWALADIIENSLIKIATRFDPESSKRILKKGIYELQEY